MTIDPRLLKVFVEVFDRPDLKLDPATTADDIDGWDSTVHISLIFRIEEEFQTQFTIEELERFGTVGDIQEALSRRFP